MIAPKPVLDVQNLDGSSFKGPSNSENVEISSLHKDSATDKKEINQKTQSSDCTNNDKITLGYFEEIPQYDYWLSERDNPTERKKV